jgi:CelD/BcsL family acetyltransferase involved in cellulose biosynthesis
MEVFEGRDVFERNRARWDELLAESGEHAFFLRSDWLASWARTVPADRRIFLAVESDAGRFVAGLPLTLGDGRIGRIRIKKLEIAGAPWFDAIEIPAVDAAVRASFVRSMLEWCTQSLGGWTALELRELPAGGTSPRALVQAASELGIACDERVCSRAPYVALSDLADGERVLSKNLRSQLKRSAKKLQELGSIEVRFELVEESDVRARLESCAEVERASWKGRTKSGTLQPESGFAFFADLCPRLARDRALALGRLFVDGRLCAYHLGFRDGARFLSYNLAQLPEVDSVGAGTYLLQGMIERARALGFESMDASRGSLTRPHSLARYTDSAREHLQLVLYGGGASGKLLELTKRKFVPSLKRWKQRFAARGEES